MREALAQCVTAFVCKDAGQFVPVRPCKDIPAASRVETESGILNALEAGQVVYSCNPLPRK